MRNQALKASDSIDEELNKTADKIFRNVFLPSEKFWKRWNKVTKKVNDRRKPSNSG